MEHGDRPGVVALLGQRSADIQQGTEALLLVSRVFAAASASSMALAIRARGSISGSFASGAGFAWPSAGGTGETGPGDGQPAGSISRAAVRAISPRGSLMACPFGLGLRICRIRETR